MLGNQLNRIVRQAIELLFLQGELAQHAYSAFDHIVRGINESSEDEFELTYPVGYSAARQPLLGSFKYKKRDLVERYEFLAHTQLALNGIYQIVIVVEGMLGDLIRAIVLRYPDKLGVRKTIKMSVVLSATSLEQVHLHAVDSVLNELSYKSPRDFAEAAADLMSVNLLECPAFHRFMEVKATRDIYLHNRGTANEVYVAKSGSHARVAEGTVLPVNTVYFLESYECCIQVAEWIEVQLHEKWPSSELEARRQTSTESNGLLKK